MPTKQYNDKNKKIVNPQSSFIASEFISHVT